MRKFSLLFLMLLNLFSYSCSEKSTKLKILNSIRDHYTSTVRFLEDAIANDDSQLYYRDNENDMLYYDEGNESNGYYVGNHDYSPSSYNFRDNRCYQYLFSFIEGKTDARDECEGIMYAYKSAQCGSELEAVKNYSILGDDLFDRDDYFTEFYNIFQGSFPCCEALKSRYFESCDNDYISPKNNLIIFSVLLLCEGLVTLLFYYKVNFIPAAGGIIVIGAFCGFVAKNIMNVDVDAIAFDTDIFLCVFLPPIIFDTSLSLDKREFRRNKFSIFMFAVIGTFLNTFLTGYMIYYSSKWFITDSSLPMLDCLVFGSLISAIDPIAMSLDLGPNMSGIMVLICGECLINNSIVVSLFEYLIGQYHHGDSSIKIGGLDDILGAIADFFIMIFSSICVALICGIGSLLYFRTFHDILNPAMEVASFILWSVVPYHIAYILEMNGIMALVVMSFFLDIYIAAPKPIPQIGESSVTSTEPRIIGPIMIFDSDSSARDDSSSLKLPFDKEVDGRSSILQNNKNDVCGATRSCYTLMQDLQLQDLLLRQRRLRMSETADKHLRFVVRLFAHLSQTALFLYIGFFLLSVQNYKWHVTVISTTILSCVLSRTMMVATIFSITYAIYKVRRRKYPNRRFDILSSPPSPEYDRKQPKAVEYFKNHRARLALILAGLRGAVSLALVESIPIYNGITGQGSMHKAEMKAMTSASIIFTIFVFGGSLNYIRQGQVK